MNNQGTTSNNNEITEEGTTSYNNDIKEGMNSTSNNNSVSEDHVTVLVAYNGKWRYEGSKWFFKNFRSSKIVVPKHVTLSEITDILYKQLKVNKKLYRLKLEVHYGTESFSSRTTEIRNDQDLSVFISETLKTKLPLCVTLLDDDAISSDVDEERRKDHVRVLVAYNGKWRWDEEKWLFENSKGSIMDVSKYITLSLITDILCKKFDFDQDSYGLKLEVHYRAGSPWFPIIEIEDDHDLSVFISESWKTKLPLCVTRVSKVVVIEGAEHGRKDDVRVLVAYNGKWRWDREKWLFENSKGSIMDVSKYVTLSQITDILCTKFKVDQDYYGLKLEVHYRGGSPWFPIIEIEDDDDLSTFISESWKTKLALCVTRVAKMVVTDGAERGHKDNKAEKRLFNAIKEDDWVKAREIVNTQEVTWTSKLDDDGYTALHFAVGRYRDNEVVKEILMGINSEELLTIVSNDMSNPAHCAAYFGNTEALKIMSASKPKCLFTADHYDLLPIHYALSATEIKTFLYLFKQMKSYKVEYDEIFRDVGGFVLLYRVIDKGLIDVAYELINEYPSLATAVYKDKTALECIIRKPELFYSGTSYSFYSTFVYHNVPTEDYTFGSTDTADVENQETPKKDKFVTKYTRRCLHDVISRICVKLWEITLLHVPYIKHLKDDKVKHNRTIKLLTRICEEADRTYTSSDIKRLYGSPFCLAVENNTAEAIDVLTTYFPRLYDSNQDGHDIYQLTVLNRSETVYSYILHHKRHAESGFPISIDDDGNNILHLAGCLAPRRKLIAASRSALQMQRELQWFEEVKKVVGKEHTRALNKNKETPMMVFRKEHEGLRKEGEEWMKKTADSYTITAALIITIVFAAAITVPGGNNDKTGEPIYETKPSFIVFAVADAISMFTATTSLLLFLFILTSRYLDEDFLYNLPKRLIYGLVMLFVSMTFMMIAFSATLYIMFGQGKPWILFPIAALACLPIASFVTLQLPLLVELISSTYGHGIFGKEKDHRLSSANSNEYDY